MSLKERYEQLYSGVVYDAMYFDLKLVNFTLASNIKPVFYLDRPVFGHAFTCLGRDVMFKGEIDDLVRIEMFKEFTPGCIQVISTGDKNAVAHFGDISGKIARKFGGVAAVIDGSTRDVRQLTEDRFPVFCESVKPVDAFGMWQIVAHQVPIPMPTEYFGNSWFVIVHPGDYLFCDNDGVIVIHKENVERVLDLAEARAEKEDEIRAEIKDTNDIAELYKRCGRW